MERDLVSAVGRPHEAPRASLQLNIFAPEERGDPISAAGSFLTGKAMAK